MSEYPKMVEVGCLACGTKFFQKVWNPDYKYRSCGCCPECGSTLTLLVDSVAWVKNNE